MSPIGVAALTQASSTAQLRPLKKLPMKDILRNFTPSWFSVTMGTGILATLLFLFPYQFPGLKIHCRCDIYLQYTDIYCLLGGHTGPLYPISGNPFVNVGASSAEHVCWHCPYCSLATIVNGLVLMIPKDTYPWILMVAWSLWWADVALTLASILIIPFSM